MRPLPTKALEKPWGAEATAPWYNNPEKLKIGEIWFETSAAVPILVKLLFTSAKLSIQVHPDDEYAELNENSRGKTEMWHILRAEPDAKVGIGLRERISPERYEAAIESGEIADLLEWVPASVGDTFFVPAGTIHAIGEGLVLCEVQQFSDVTYRVHDYDRGRELHIEQALNVSALRPLDGRVAPVSLGPGRALLAECRYFRTERLAVAGRLRRGTSLRSQLYFAVSGQGTIGGTQFSPGQGWELPPGGAPVEIDTDDAVFVVVS